jgi:hypothetical protein
MDISGNGENKMKELKVVKFIKEHENWRELLIKEPYCLKIQESEEEGWENLVLLKYDQIHSDFSEEICKECRGLILEKGTWKVVRAAFWKFFNLGEKYADEIDWESASATSKEDGSLISLYSYDGVWRVASNGNMCAGWAPLDNGGYKTFRDLFEAAFEKYNVDVESLDPRYTYTFELCSPFNMIVCQYDEIQLFLTCVRNNETLEEVNVEIEGVPRPQFYALNSREEYEALVENLGENREGIVVKDKFNRRVKMKTLLYFQLHRIAENGKLSLERAVELIMANDTDEFLSYFPQYTGYMGKIKSSIENCFEVADYIDNWVYEWKLADYTEDPKARRAEFAKYVKDKPFTPLFFVAYDGRDVLEYVGTFNARKLINFFKLHDYE